MATIQNFTGIQYPRSNQDLKALQAWKNNNYQYATSTHEVDHDMSPALILQPKGDDDIITAIKYAKQNGLAIAIKSGGHQYSGASSTSGQNIQLDLGKTFKDPTTDLKIVQGPADNKPWIYASVSWNLGEFNGWLGQNHFFVPHGQCTDVHIGGHAQTGGYGQLGRSFGLLGDHIREIRLIDHDANIRTIDQSSDPELFYGILGGSPGNFGVITHYTIEVHRDRDHDFSAVGGYGPRGLKCAFLYSQATVEALLNKVAEMADNPDTARNYDLCVSVLSSDFPFLHLFPELDGAMRLEHPEIFGLDKMPNWPAMVVVYAQWVPFTKDDKPDDQWFQDFKQIELLKLAMTMRGPDWPMSKITPQWIFGNIREFDHPYVKRTYMTNSTSLVQDQFVSKVAASINKVVGFHPTDLWEQCWLSCQIQCFGGKNSAYHTNADNGTSYSWRDSTVCATLDCFHESAFAETANAWAESNDQLLLGTDGCYSKDDKRVLWGSYGDWNMDTVWPCYYEDQAKYKRLQAARAMADPDGTFTPNPFCVKRGEVPKL